MAEHFFAEHVGKYSSLESVLDSIFVLESEFNSESEFDFEFEFELGI